MCGDFPASLFLFILFCFLLFYEHCEEWQYESVDYSVNEYQLRKSYQKQFEIITVKLAQLVSSSLMVWESVTSIPYGAIVFAHMKTFNLVEITLDREFAANCLVVTCTKHVELILVAMVICIMYRVYSWAAKSYMLLL